MKSHVDAAIAKSKDGIAAVFPDSRGELLNKTISWEDAYNLPSGYADDGRAIPVDQTGFFEPWKHLLQGLTLVPGK